MILPEAFLTLAAFGLLTRMRIVAKEANPPGYLLVGKKELTPEDLVYQSDRTNLTPLLAELVDMGFIAISVEQGRRRVVVKELLQESAPPAVDAAPTGLRTDGYREWSMAYQPTHESNCPAMWDAALAAGWKAERIVAIARWYAKKCAKENKPRMRSTEFFRRLLSLEEEYLLDTRAERDGKAVWSQEKIEVVDDSWKQEVLQMFDKSSKAEPKAGKRVKAA